VEAKRVGGPIGSAPGPRPEEPARAATPQSTTALAADAMRVTGRDGAAACEAGCEAAPTACARRKVSSRIAWATLLHRVWEWDVLQCPRCDGRMKVIALIQDRAVIVKILTHMGLSAAEIVPAPPRRWDDTS